MGLLNLLNLLLGKTKIISYEILFGDNNEIAVNTTKHISSVSSPEYIRLWATYTSKIIFNLGGLANLSTKILLGALEKITQKDLTINSNCFKEAEMDDAIKYVKTIDNVVSKFTGDFYAKGSTLRTINTKFPLRLTEQMAIYSSIALMRYSIVQQDKDKELLQESLEVFTKTIQNLVSLYESRIFEGLKAMTHIPHAAYLKAIGAIPEEGEGQKNC